MKFRSYLQAIVVVLAPACSGGADPDSIARRFVDAYYVEYDYGRALEVADGAARFRLEGERALADAVRARVAIADSSSRTYYEDPVRRDVSAELVHFTFELEIRDGPNTLRRTAVVMLGKRQGVFKVINFREAGAMDPAGERVGGVATSTGAAPSDGVRTSTGAGAGERREPGESAR